MPDSRAESFGGQIMGVVVGSGAENSVKSYNPAIAGMMSLEMSDEEGKEPAMIRLGGLIALCFICLAGCVHAEAVDPYVVVWNTPSKNSSGSMPLGNGDIGVNCWVEESGDIYFYLSKTDAWSGIARLLKLGRVHVSFSPNPFTRSAVFEQKLDARAGTIEISAGEVKIRLWVDANYPAVRLECQSPAPVEVRAELECWRTGSRALIPEELDSAYGLTESPEPVVEEPDVFVTAPPDWVMWYHRNETSVWPMTMRLQGMASWIDQGKDPLLHRTFGGLMQGEGFKREGTAAVTSTAAMEHHLSVYLLTDQTESAHAWQRKVEQLAASDTVSWKDRYAAHLAWWKTFWDRSWIRISGPDADVVNQGYVLQRFISACAGRGALPVKFNGSIFTVDAEKNGKRLDADYRQWGGPYWFQNTRLVYWPMLASGDFEMMQPLFRMYREALPFAKARTKVYFGHEGAFFPETMYFWGGYAQDNYGWKRTGLEVGVTENMYIRYYYSGALELLVMMLDHYAYTQNKDFARDTMLPFAREVITFYDKHYPRDAQGKLRIEPSQSLETWQKAVNPLPPIAGLRRTLALLLNLPAGLVDEAQRKEWQRFLNELPDIPMKDGVLAAAGEILEEAKNSENPELYAVYPYRLYGVGKPELEMARRTYEQRRIKGNNGWRQDDTQAAFLGLAEEARKGLVARLRQKNEGSRFPAFWGPNFDWIPDQDHGTNALMALQTMLLQAEGEAIYLFPAWPKAWDVEFKLHAPRNTTIEGEYRDGSVKKLFVTPPDREKDLVRFIPSP